jgi:hypothetical protein
MTYFILRHLGLTPTATLDAIKQMRPVTHAELVKPMKKMGGRTLQELAEALFRSTTETAPVLTRKVGMFKY